MNEKEFRDSIKPTLDHLESLLRKHGCAYVVGIEVGRGFICSGLSGNAERVIPVPFYKAAACIDPLRFKPLPEQAVGKREGFADAAPTLEVGVRAANEVPADAIMTQASASGAVRDFHEMIDGATEDGCRATMGHGEFCSSGHLCGNCELKLHLKAQQSRS